jgi:hypothetical protein
MATFVTCQQQGATELQYRRVIMNPIGRAHYCAIALSQASMSIRYI